MTADSYDEPWVSVVGGGSSGIGLACAERLLRAGAQVVLAGIDSGGSTHPCSRRRRRRSVPMRASPADEGEPI